MRRCRQRLSFIRLLAYLRTRESFMKKNKTPPERGLSIVRRRRQRLSFIRLLAYLRTREPFMIKKQNPAVAWFIYRAAAPATTQLYQITRLFAYA